MEDIQRERHAAYMRELRRSREYKDRENKLRILGRITEGSVPHVRSLTKYNITRNDINDLRRRNGLDDLIENIPYWHEATRRRRRNMEDPSSYVPEAPPARSTPDLPTRVGTVGDANKDAFSVKAINIHFRTRGREIGTKTNQRAKQGTISRQFGPPNSDEKSGSFARFMKFLGPRYLEDARELLGRNALRRIETEMTKKHKKDRQSAPGQSEFIQLSTMVKLLETVLIVLREYPPFDALCRVPEKSDDDCDEPTQQSVKKRYEEIDALFNKYDAQVSAARLAKPREGVQVLPFKEIKRRVERAFPRNSQEIPKQYVYINMYAEFVSRDDMKNLKLSTERPPQTVDALKGLRLKQNTLYVSKKSAVIALVDYKTSNLYGPQRFAFSERVSKLIWEYIKLNKLLETDRTSGTLFGKSGMSTFVGNMLDAIGQPRGNEGAINVLRKSYVSSEMDKAGAGMTAEERQALAFHMRHSVNTSYKYVRDLAKDKAIDVQRLRREVRPIG